VKGGVRKVIDLEGAEKMRFVCVIVKV